MSKRSTPVDVHVGRRTRIRRVLCGLSQTALAEKLGITFQQLQKRESGANRTSAGDLWKTAQVLEVPVEWFFAGLDGEEGPEIETKRETLELVKNIQGCPPEVQKRFRALALAISGNLTSDESGSVPMAAE